jgi:hypothetical protein
MANLQEQGRYKYTTGDFVIGHFNCFFFLLKPKPAINVCLLHSALLQLSSILTPNAVNYNGAGSSYAQPVLI